MQDTIIKGTGDSRSLKCPPNLLATYPTWEAAAQALQTGTFPVDIGNLNPLGVLQMGTPYDKPNVLSDETAALYGKDDTATVDDILASIPPSISASTAALRTYQKFTTSGTWTPPDDMEGDEIFVVMVGGGGGGGGGGARGGGSYGGYGGQGGQGGSGYIKIFSARVDKETAYPFTIGAGGTGAPVLDENSMGDNGGNGGNTQFMGYTASGGKGGLHGKNGDYGTSSSGGQGGMGGRGGDGASGGRGGQGGNGYNSSYGRRGGQGGTGGNGLGGSGSAGYQSENFYGGPGGDGGRGKSLPLGPQFMFPIELKLTSCFIGGTNGSGSFFDYSGIGFGGNSNSVGGNGELYIFYQKKAGSIL